MLKKILAFSLIFWSFFIYSQNDDNSCVFVNYKLNVLNEETEEVQNEKAKEIVKQISKSISNLEYALYCNYNSSIYFKIDKLDVKENPISKKLASRFGGKGIYYKNIKEKIKFHRKESLGETFNIQLDNDDWVITKEKKIIQGYTCFKATSTREEINYYRGTKSVFKPTVWFTPEIPLPFGPKGLDGLPGLVLEGTINGKTIIYASKIEFNSKDCKKKLVKPSKGIDIKKEDYGKLMAKKRNE